MHTYNTTEGCIREVDSRVAQCVPSQRRVLESISRSSRRGGTRTNNISHDQHMRTRSHEPTSPWLDTLRVLGLAVLVRLLTTATLLLVPNYLPAFDKSADAVLPANDRWIQGFLRWDSLYFLQIAQDGYTRENEFAFMPALPALMRILGMGWEERWKPSVKSMVLATVCLANLAALGAAVLFHRYVCATYGPAVYVAVSNALRSQPDSLFDCCAIGVLLSSRLPFMYFHRPPQHSRHLTTNLSLLWLALRECWLWNTRPVCWQPLASPEQPLSEQMGS